MDEHDNDVDECGCPICKAKRTMFEKIEEINREAVANGAANCRRDLWLSTFKIRMKLGDMPQSAADLARLSILEFDKAFPEVRAAAMMEDR